MWVDHQIGKGATKDLDFPTGISFASCGARPARPPPPKHTHTTIPKPSPDKVRTLPRACSMARHRGSAEWCRREHLECGPPCRALAEYCRTGRASQSMAAAGGRPPPSEATRRETGTTWLCSNVACGELIELIKCCYFYNIFLQRAGTRRL